MISLRSLSFSAALLLLPAAVPLTAADAPRNAIAFWQTSELRAADKDIVIPEDVNGNSIEVLAEMGAVVLEDKEAPGEHALMLNGTQATAARAKRRVTIPPDVKLTFSAKPMDGAKWQTLIYLFRIMELRYNPDAGTLTMYVYPDAGGATQVALPIEKEEWSKITATVKGTEMTLQVNEQSQTITLPGPLTTLEGNFSIGCGDGRPYTGALADIAISPLEN